MLLHRILRLFLLAGFIFHAHPRLEQMPERVAVLPEAQIRQDDWFLLRQRQGMAAAICYLRDQCPWLNHSQKSRFFSPRQRETVCRVWSSLLDRQLALDSLGRFYEDLHRSLTGAERRTAFRLSFAAFVFSCHTAHELIPLLDRNPSLRIVLNEQSGSPLQDRGGYDSYKIRFLNVRRATEFVRLWTIYRYYGEDPRLVITPLLEEDQATLWRAAEWRGPLLTLNNARQIVETSLFTTWFPVQKGISEWMGDTKVARPGRSLVSAEQIAKLQQLLEPGDILLARRHWYLSNTGLPGYWPHAALFIGTPEQRTRYFRHSGVEKYLRSAGEATGQLERLLQREYPESWRKSGLQDAHGERPAFLEAQSEGVCFTTPAHALGADSVAVLRPRIARAGKAEAIRRAFGYAGRPYDFNFDFRTDEALVCTELVYKSYVHDGKAPGLYFPVIEVMGRPVTPANEIARHFDAVYGTTRQELDLVCFLDGIEKTGGAVPAGLDEFRRSWRRPKWHLLQQTVPQSPVPSALDPKAGASPD